ncbi:hypothetical protein K438DRAFT_2110387 [Mycena galopus ATCC 62051]|nr:hypothetical protein K438DRAFT_2110387 [Mycena galopus ATCC 62051]
MSNLVSARTAIQSVNSGKAANEDAWMTQWYSINWDEALQLAPLSIALLGSILVLASSTDDFSLDTKAPAGCPPFPWKYALRPDSFKSCLQQMVGDSYMAFETAHRNMESIMNNSSQMPGVIKDIVNLVLQGTPQDIEDHFQNATDDLQALIQTCRDRAKETEAAFHAIVGLAQEMVLACTYTAGTAEQALMQNKIQLEVLRIQKESEEMMVKEAEASCEMGKNVETEVNQAIDEVPSGWELMGMQVIESLTNVVVSAGPATPPTPPSAQGATGVAQLAVQNAKMKVDQTRSQLEASRASFEKEADRLCKQRQEITATLGEMTRLQLNSGNLQHMLPVFIKVVGAFTTLHAQFSQLSQFFDSVSPLLKGVMGPSVKRWVDTMNSAAAQVMRGGKEPQLAGVTVSNFTRDLIYRQMMTPLKVSMQATKISTVYLEISNDYILPAQRNVGRMLQFSESSSAADEQALVQKLTKSQNELAQSSTLASSQISARVAADQKTFGASINTRLNTIVQAIQPAIGPCL